MARQLPNRRVEVVWLHEVDSLWVEICTGECSFVGFRCTKSNREAVQDCRGAWPCADTHCDIGQTYCPLGLSSVRHRIRAGIIPYLASSSVLNRQSQNGNPLAGNFSPTCLVNVSRGILRLRRPRPGSLEFIDSSRSRVMACECFRDRASRRPWHLSPLRPASSPPPTLRLAGARRARRAPYRRGSWARW